jgi:O-antigen ligase
MIVICVILLCAFPYVATRLTNIGNVFSSNGSATFRLQMIRDTFRIGMNEPLGVGLAMTPYYFATQFGQEHPIYGPDYPHNLFSELFAETGVCGLFFFLVFLYIVFRNFFIKHAQKQSLPFYIGSLLFFLCAMIYPLTFDAIEIISLAFLYMGFAVTSDTKTV